MNLFILCVIQWIAATQNGQNGVNAQRNVKEDTEPEPGIHILNNKHNQ